MQCFGESKREALTNGTEKDKIFSFSTYKTYGKHIKYFIKYIKENHPDCTTIKSARKYVGEWLQARSDQRLSAWMVQMEAKALGKLYGITLDDEGSHLVKQLGIQGYCGQKYEDMLAGRDWITEEEENNNIMLEKQMRANYRSGYWEVLFFHTKPLGIVPKDMRVS